MADSAVGSRPEQEEDPKKSTPCRGQRDFQPIDVEHRQIPQHFEPPYAKKNSQYQFHCRTGTGYALRVPYWRELARTPVGQESFVFHPLKHREHERNGGECRGRIHPENINVACDRNPPLMGAVGWIEKHERNPHPDPRHQVAQQRKLEHKPIRRKKDWTN